MEKVISYTSHNGGCERNSENNMNTKELSNENCKSKLVYNILKRFQKQIDNKGNFKPTNWDIVFMDLISTGILTENDRPIYRRTVTSLSNPYSLLKYHNDGQYSLTDEGHIMSMNWAEEYEVVKPRIKLVNGGNDMFNIKSILSQMGQSVEIITPLGLIKTKASIQGKQCYFSGTDTISRGTRFKFQNDIYLIIDVKPVYFKDQLVYTETLIELQPNSNISDNKPTMAEFEMKLIELDKIYNHIENKDGEKSNRKLSEYDLELNMLIEKRFGDSSDIYHQYLKEKEEIEKIYRYSSNLDEYKGPAVTYCTKIGSLLQKIIEEHKKRILNKPDPKKSIDSPNAIYDVSLSFAGENRKYVEEVAKNLKEFKLKIFYDEYERVDLWGKNLYEHFDDIYRKKSKYCVMFVSKYYAEKVWTNHERKSAQARALTEKQEYILPVRFDDTEIPGLLPTIDYIDATKISPYDLALMIKEKCERNNKQ